MNSTDMKPAFTLVWVLAHLDAPVAANVMIGAATHRNEFVRWAAVIGLGRLRLKRARLVLNKAAADRSSAVRGAAVRALKSIGDESTLPVLEKRLSDRYPGIRSAAAEAIEAIQRRRKA